MSSDKRDLGYVRSLLESQRRFLNDKLVDRECWMNDMARNVPQSTVHAEAVTRYNEAKAALDRHDAITARVLARLAEPTQLGLGVE